MSQKQVVKTSSQAFGGEAPPCHANSVMRVKFKHRYVILDKIFETGDKKKVGREVFGGIKGNTGLGLLS